MYKVLVASLFVMTLFSCKKENVQSLPKENTVLFYRLAIQKLDATTALSKIVVVKPNSGKSVLNEKNDNNPAHENEHYDGDGCDENAPDFCQKHPTHRKCVGVILPLTLEYFYAQAEKNYVGVYWKVNVGMENEVKQYIIERSEDGKTFKPVVNVKPQGTQEEYMAVDWFNG